MPVTPASFEANASQLTATSLDASRSPQQLPPMRGAPGADSAAPVTHRIGDKTLVELATQSFGKAPVFWGRYFTSRTTTGSVEYRHRVESAALRAAGIRVLPIARQTNRVDGSEEEGVNDGRANAEDLVATFGGPHLVSLVSQGGEVFMFLDVEGPPHALSADYYTGWCQGLADVEFGGTIHPCLYATQSDSGTWSALDAAVAAGAPCKGLWVARWFKRPGFQPIADWSQVKTSPQPAVSAPVLLWQYANAAFGNDGFDCNQVNPALDLEQVLLRFLVLPPAEP